MRGRIWLFKVSELDALEEALGSRWRLCSYLIVEFAMMYVSCARGNANAMRNRREVVVNRELVEAQERIEVGCDQRSIVKVKG